MKIAILNNCVPFLYGGAEFLADCLCDKLKEYGHQAAVYRIPFAWDPPEKIVDHMLASRLTKIPNADRVIALKFPVYLVDHPDKVVWLLHQFRQAYDLWGTEYQSIPSTAEGLQIRNSIIESDNRILGKVKRLFTNSPVVSDRLMKFNNIASEVLFPPLIDDHLYRFAAQENFIFYPSRINHSKRQHLVIEAMKYVRSDVKLVLAGKPDKLEDLRLLEHIIVKNGLEQRVEIRSGFIPQEEKADLFARCLACTYTPYDEDSYGYVTLEAYHSRKPVITCSDSGGTDVVVKEGHTGYVVLPDPVAIAEKIDCLAQNRKLAADLGQQGFEHLQTLNITWDHVIKRLTE